MNQYEVMYVIDTALEDQARNDIIARFSALVSQNGGTVDRIDEWGKRRLAYAINYKTEGYYVLMYVTAPSDLPRELERNLQISEAILRYLVIRFEGALPPKREPLRPFVPAGQAASAPMANARETDAPVTEETIVSETEPEAPVTEPEVPVADDVPEAGSSASAEPTAE